MHSFKTQNCLSSSLGNFQGFHDSYSLGVISWFLCCRTLQKSIAHMTGITQATWTRYIKSCLFILYVLIRCVVTRIWLLKMLSETTDLLLKSTHSKETPKTQFLHRFANTVWQDQVFARGGRAAIQEATYMYLRHFTVHQCIKKQISTNCLNTKQRNLSLITKK